MSTPTYAHGKFGQVQFNGVVMDTLEWDLNVDVDEVDITGHLTNLGLTAAQIPGKDKLIGNADATGNIEFRYNAAVDNFAPLGIYPGAVALIQLYPVRGGPFWSFRAILKPVKQRAPANGKVDFSSGFTSIGPITVPTGTTVYPPAA